MTFRISWPNNKSLTEKEELQQEEFGIPLTAQSHFLAHVWLSIKNSSFTNTLDIEHDPNNMNNIFQFLKTQQL